MALAVNLADFLLRPVEAVGFDIPRPSRRSKPVEGIWIPMFDSKVTDDDIKNYFRADVTFRNPHGVAVSLCFLVSGGETVEDVAYACFTKLRKVEQLGPDLVSAVFRTIEEKPLIIPRGTLMAELYKTNSDDSVVVKLEATIVDLKDGERFFITPEAVVIGDWMNGFLQQ